MIKKKAFILSLISLLALVTLIHNAYAPYTGFIIHAESFGIDVPSGLRGQHNWVLLTATTNIINSTSDSVLNYRSSGYLVFTSNETFTLQLDFNFSNVALAGDQGNDYRPVSNGSSHAIVAGDTVAVYWNTVLEPYIPITFLFWIVGLVMCFIGPLMGIKQIKKGDYREGLITITVICAVGFSLLLGGMFSA